MRVEEERMKESWMDKLIELLNEYEDWMVSWVKEYSEEFGVFVLNTEQMIEEEIIISKSFGFIGWLVENDKINFRKLDPKINDSIPTRYYLWTYIRYSFEKEILMTLSIQDNPIEFLISILR